LYRAIADGSEDDGDDREQSNVDRLTKSREMTPLQDWLDVAAIE
jgi:hypothetical protein